MEDQQRILEDISSSLRELVKITRVVSQPKIQLVLGTALNTKDKINVYTSMDGEKSVTDIQKLTGVNVRFISEWGQEWENLGIVEPSTSSNIRGRRQKLFNLAIYGIDVDNVVIEES